MPVARLRLRIVATRTREDDEGNRQVGESAAQLDIGMGRVGRALGSRRGGLRLWHKVAIFLAPALFIVGKHLIGVAAGLITMGAVVSAAAAPWIGLAVTAAMNAEKMGAAGVRFSRGTDAVGRAWMDLARRTAPETLGPVTDVLDGIANAIPKLEPLVREVAPDMARMARDIEGWLSGRGLERFLEVVGRYGVPAFENLTLAGKDFLATLGRGFRDFLPLAEDISETLQRGAADLRSNAKNGGIARWLEDWKRNAPAANRFLREAAETLGNMGQLLDDLGTGTLGAVDTALTALNKIDPNVLMGIVLAWTSGKSIVGLVAALRMVLAIRALRAISFLPSAAQLAAATAALNTAAGVLATMAAALNALAELVRRSVRIRVDSSALDRIKAIWDGIPKNGSARVALGSVNIMAVAMMGVDVTWATVSGNLSQTAVFSARAAVGPAVAVMAAMVVAWIAVRASALAMPVFTAIAIPGTALAGMTLMVTSWMRVRALAAAPVFFTVTASPGNVSAVASTIVAAWARVRAASAVRPRFTAFAIGANVVAGAAAIVAAWMRVVRMPKLWRAIGIVRPGNVPGASRSIYNSWRRLYNLARSWSGIATCNFSGGFSGISGPSGPMLPSMGGGTPIQGGYGPLPGPVSNILQKIPGFDNFGTTPDYLGGGDPFFPDDFGGSFGRAYGGPVGNILGGYNRAPRMTSGMGGGQQTLHIYDDVWIRSPEDLVNILMEASK